MSNLAQRVLTALVGVPLVIGLMWWGGWPFALLIAAIAAAAQFELYGLMNAGGARPLVAFGLLAGLTATLWPMLPPAPEVLAACVVLLPVLVMYTRRDAPLADAAATAFGVLYPAGLASSILLLRSSEAVWLGADGAFWITTTILFCVWASDTFAYAAGRLFGRTPLFERVSPKKTWEGSIGGAVGAFLLAAGFKLAVLDATLTWFDVSVIAVASGMVSQLGDLAESHFKRSVGVKDSATWLPGHGGLLDRIDATVIAVPLVALYFEVTKGGL
ncbi:MAG: phosphatidate cytidylyltransferase [Bacteroidota bacterium]